MKRVALNLMLLGSIFAAPVLVGCDRTVSEEKTTKTNSDGTTETKKNTTVQKSDGTVEKTTEKEVQK
jgi:hypothetical protein